MSEPLLRLRPMELGEILDRSVRVFRQAWKRFLLIALIGLIPDAFGRVLGLLSHSGTADFQRIDLQLFLLQAIQGVDVGAVEAPWSGLWTLLHFAVAPLTDAAAILLCARILMGQSFTGGELFRLGRRRYWSILGTTVLVGVYVGIPTVLFGMLTFAIGWAALLLIAAGVVLAMVLWVFADHAILLEEQEGGNPALRRSKELVAGRFWRLLLYGAIFSVATHLITTAVNLSLGLVHSLLVGGTWSALLVTFGHLLAAAVTTAFTLVGKTIVYYDTRVRKEGLDLQIAVNEHQGF